MPKRKEPTLDVGDEITGRVTRRKASHATSTAVSDTVNIQDGQHADPCESTGLSSAPSLSQKPKMKLQVKNKRRVREPVPSSPVPSDEERGEDADASGAVRKSSRRRTVKSLEYTSAPADSSKPKRERKPLSPIVYDIPDVVRKETTFKGQHEPFSQAESN
jgi:hypothetical protein